MIRKYCCFCAIPQLKLGRHLKLMYSDEEQIQKFLNVKLRNLGNHSHNQSVLEKALLSL